MMTIRPGLSPTRPVSLLLVLFMVSRVGDLSPQRGVSVKRNVKVPAKVRPETS
jgi:hypothetical protein